MIAAAGNAQHEQCLLVRGHQPTERCEHRRFEWVLAAEELTALLDAA
jgi:hypothetical protein